MHARGLLYSSRTFTLVGPAYANILAYSWNLQNRSSFPVCTSYHCLISSSLFFMQENMTRMLMVTDVQDIIKRHQAQIITSLKDPDIRLIWSLCVFLITYSLLLFHSRSTLSKMCCWNNQVSKAQIFLPKHFLSVTCAWLLLKEKALLINLLTLELSWTFNISAVLFKCPLFW